ncbi:MAG: alpha-N-arabinofuranosidase [Ignavibacteriaceae bacterium]
MKTLITPAALKISLIAVTLLFIFSGVSFSQANKVVINPDAAKDTISRHIYGHFSEHLGRCIYGGIWVGEDSKIPNTRGIRNDVVAALKNIKVANLRWPGGCFADEYHWMDGIGPRDKRPKMVNTNWGGVVEDNSFGTHEFMDLCEQIGTEPVICGNIGSGSVDELSDWVTYLTSDAENPMTELRKKNGRDKPWKVKYWCVGNETWGCGGVMDPEFYANEMARYSWFMRNYGDNSLYKIASGGLESDYNWTEIVMKKWSGHEGWLQSYMSGYSLHYYTVTNNWTVKGSATNFTEDEWITTLTKTLRMDTLVTKHSEVMDKYDPQKKVGLIVDEWGNWFDVEPGTNPGFLYQQNTLRDAMVAALNLNIFNKHADRVKMSNIAQVVNVLQAVILTEDEKMLLTPTYHVFDLYKVHQDALNLPLDITSEDYELNGQIIPALSATASKSKDGTVNISLVNTNPSKEMSLTCTLKGLAGKPVTGKVLTSANMQDHNTFEQPDNVKVEGFSNFKVNGDEITINLPSKSIVTLEVK